MIRLLGAVLVSLIAAGAATRTLSGRSAVPAAGYEEVKDWLHLPQGLELGEVPGVDVDSRGEIDLRGGNAHQARGQASPALRSSDQTSDFCVQSGSLTRAL